MNLRSVIFSILFVGSFIMFTSQSHGQPSPCDDPEIDPSECLDAPFDGGASLLIAGGAGLLGWTAFKKKKQK